MPTISFDVTNAEAVRIRVAVGHILGLGRDATAEEARQFFISKVKQCVLQDERERFLKQYADVPINPA